MVRIKWFKTTLILLAASSILTGCKDKTSETQSYGEIGITEGTEETHSPISPVEVERDIVLLPNTETLDDRTMEGYELAKLPGMRISINYPTGGSIYNKDNYNLYITMPDGTIYWLHKYYNCNFKDSMDISYYAKDVINKAVYYKDNDVYNGSIYDYGTKSSHTGINGMDITSELPSLQMNISNGVGVLIPNIASAYMIKSSNAYVLCGLSEAIDSEQLEKTCVDILGSMQYYEPSQSSIEVDLSNTITIGGNVQISLPNWESGVKGGFTFYSMPCNSVYDSTVIYTCYDNNKTYGVDYLNLPLATDRQVIDFLYSYQTTDYEVVSKNKQFNHITINNLNGYFMDVKSEITPQSQKAINALSSYGTDIYTFRYSFEDKNGVPFMIGFIYDKDNEDQVYYLADKIINTIKER